MKRILFSTTAVLCLLAGQALADGYLRGAPRVACCEPAAEWSGFYLGAGIGGGAVVHDFTFDIAGTGGPVRSDGVGGQGVFGTVIVGYDHQTGANLVLGILADYDVSNISTDFSAFGLFTATIDHAHSWSVGGRLGVLTSPSTLWYGTAGYTQARFDLGTNVGLIDAQDFNGYFLGAGVESRLSGGWSLRAEYRFTQFENETVLSLPGVARIDLDPSMHTARLALTYKFGRREEVVAPLK